MPRMFFSAALAAGLSIAAFAPAAMAGTAQIHLNDLDLSTDAGKAELNNRIEKAAVSVCSRQIGTGTMFKQRVSRSCVNETRAQLEQQIAARIADGNLGG